MDLKGMAETPAYSSILNVLNCGSRSALILSGLRIALLLLGSVIENRSGGFLTEAQTKERVFAEKCG